MMHRAWRLLAPLMVCSYGSFGANFAVDTPADGIDNNPGDGICATSGAPLSCTLRAAIMEANALPGADIVTLPGGQTYLLAIGGANENAGASGDLDITDSVTILSPTDALSTIDGGGLDRVLHINGFSLDVTLIGLVIRNGSVFGSEGGGILAQTTPGNFSNLSVSNCIIENNSANGGGGISSVFITTLTDCIVRNNQSQLNFNLTTGSPGISAARRTVDVTRSAIYGNTSPANTISIVGAIHVVDGQLSVNSTTVSGNSHAGIRISDSDLELRNATIFGNATDGINILHTENKSVFIRNSIVANNGVDDCSTLTIMPAVTSLDVDGHNIDSDGSCGLAGGTGNMPNTDPLLGPLADYGFQSPAHLPLAGSPAIDAGSTLFQGLGLPDACESMDQQGFSRLVDGNFDGIGRCDIGAVEANADVQFRDGFED